MRAALPSTAHDQRYFARYGRQSYPAPDLGTGGGAGRGRRQSVSDRGKPCAKNFSYTSDKNKFLTMNDLKKVLKNNIKDFELN